MKGRQFMDKNGKISIVKDSYQNMTIFEDGTKIDTRYLLDKKYYAEVNPVQNNQNNNQYPQQQQNLYPQNTVVNYQNNVVDPNMFNNRGNALLEQMQMAINKAIPDDMVDRIPIGEDFSARNREFYPTDNSSTIIMADPELEREEVARRNQHLMSGPAQISSKLNSDPRISKILQEDDEYIPVVENRNQTTVSYLPPPMTDAVLPNQAQPRQPFPAVVEQPNYDENRGRASVKIEGAVETKNTQFNQYIDPIIAMFKKAKRNTDFKISIEIENKIPRLDYIEMMEDSYEDTSIIQFLAQEFTEKLLANPSIIKDMIVEELTSMLEEHQDRPRQPKIKEMPKSSDLLIDSKKNKSKKYTEEILEEEPKIEVVMIEDQEDVHTTPSTEHLQEMIDIIKNNSTIEELMGLNIKEKD